MAVRNGEGTPRYVVVGSGPTMIGPTWPRSSWPATRRGGGAGRSKKDAEQEAARRCLGGSAECLSCPKSRRCARTCRERWPGKKIKSVAVANGRSVRRHASAKHFRAPLEGRSIKSVGRLGKYLLMTPRQRRHPGGPPRHERPAAPGEVGQGPQAQAHPRGDHLHPGGRVALRRSPDLRRAVRLHAAAQDRRHADSARSRARPAGTGRPSARPSPSWPTWASTRSRT